MSAKTIWEVKGVAEGAKALGELLSEGWEPFSVSSGIGVRVWLRRATTVLPLKAAAAKPVLSRPEKLGG